MFAAFGCFSFVVFVALIAHTCSFNNEFTEQYELQEKRKAIEKKRLENLPVIKAVIVADSVEPTPFYDKKAALCFLRIGYEVSYTKSRSKRKRQSATTYYRFEFKDTIRLTTNAGARLRVNNTLYNIDFKNARILNWYNHTLKTFTTNRYAADVAKGKMPDSIRYISKYRNLEPIVDCYFTARFEKHAVQKCTWFRNLTLQEIAYQNADTVIFNGKIENGKIIPLY